MKSSLICAACASAFISLSISLMATQAQPIGSPRTDTSTDVVVRQAKPKVYVLAVPLANAMVIENEMGCTYVGVQAPPLVAAARALKGCQEPGFRYAVMTEDDDAPKLGDGGWAQKGVLTIAHERLYRRMLPFAKSGETKLPAASFSGVMQLWLKAEEIHLVHAESAYSDADIIAHVEKIGVLYTGNQFTNDGYPSIRADRGGSLPQMIQFADYFIRNYDLDRNLVEPIVPGRGQLATMDDLREYSAMLIVVHKRISDWMAKPFTLKRIIEGQPTREFDARWGHGPVSAAAFVTQVYDSLAKAQQKAAPPAPAPAGHDHK